MTGCRVEGWGIGGSKGFELRVSGFELRVSDFGLEVRSGRPFVPPISTAYTSDLQIWFQSDYHTFTSTLLIKIGLCSKFP